MGERAKTKTLRVLVTNVVNKSSVVLCETLSHFFIILSACILSAIIMGTMRLALLLAMIVLLVYVHKGETLKCWHCDNMQLRGCSEPFLGSADDIKEDHPFVKDCESIVWRHHTQILPNGTTYTEIVNPGLMFVCLKITGKLLGDKFISRDCALGLPNITEGSCLPNLLESDFQIRLPITIETCETCAGDLCNGVASMSRTAVLMAPLLQFLLLMK